MVPIEIDMYLYSKNNMATNWKRLLPLVKRMSREAVKISDKDLTRSNVSI
jgi:hypothetical protein